MATVTPDMPLETALPSLPTSVSTPLTDVSAVASFTPFTLLMVVVREVSIMLYVAVEVSESESIDVVSSSCCSSLPRTYTSWSALVAIISST